MKSIKMLLLAVAITFSSAISASTVTEDAEINAITTDVSKRLKNPKFLLEKNELVNVTLIVNKDNELVVLSVDSDNFEISDFIKSRLNYSKVSVQLDNISKKFIVPVRLSIKE